MVSLPLHAVSSALHKLQHALDGITDLHQSLNVLILHAGGWRGEHHSLGTYGAGELDADLMLRDGQQDVYREGIFKEFALFKADDQHRGRSTGVAGVQLIVKVAVQRTFRLHALRLFLRQFKFSHVLQAGGLGANAQKAGQLGLRDIIAKGPVRHQKACQRVAAGDGGADVLVQLPHIV